MDLNRYSKTALDAMDYAYGAAEKLNLDYVGSEHILLGISMNSSAASALLRSYGVTYDTLIPYIDKPSRKRRTFTDASGLTVNAQRILEFALYEAVSSGDALIGDTHLLLAILRERNCMGYGLITLISYDAAQNIKQALKKSNLMDAAAPSPESTDDAVRLAGHADSVDEGETVVNEGWDAAVSNANQTLNVYARDITALAKIGGLDPLIGCEKELKRLIQILCRRLKNNPILIGEAGVGKTAIVEGLAQRIAAGDCPDELRTARIMSLDIAAMIAGTRYRGDFEERLKRLLDELGGDERLILFIDEIHTIVGTGAGESGLDAANIMKPMLARGGLRLIGTTTFDEYKKYIEKDPALERRFLPVVVKEPSQNETISILNGIKAKYEKYHNALIPDDTVATAVEMSVRYISDRALPDKAIDLMDEAASLAKLASNIARKPSDCDLRNSAITADVPDNKSLCSDTRQTFLDAVRAGANSGIVVRPEHVAKVISDRLGIPMDFLLERESERALKLESYLMERVVGQEEAIGRIARELRKSLAGLKNENRPICTLLICSSPASGKTMLALETARALFGDDGAIIRIDLSEFPGEAGIMSLIGTPPVYRDSETGGVLTEALRRRPYCAVIFDNADRASMETLKLTLKAVEDGYILNAKNKRIGLENAVVIYTADVPANAPRTTGFGAAQKNMDDTEYFATIEKIFGRKLEGVFDVMVRLKPLDDEKLACIAANAAEELRCALKKRTLDVEFGKDSIKKISAEALEKCSHDARSVKRYVFEKLETTLSEALLSGDIDRTKRILCTVNADELSFKNEMQMEVAQKRGEPLPAARRKTEGNPVFLIAPDKFKGTMCAEDVSGIISASAKKFFPNCDTVLLPIADGGEGTAQILAQTVRSRRCSAMVCAPDGRRVCAEYYVTDDGTAIIDMAQAAGYSLMAGSKFDPCAASTFGVGELILNAADMRCRTIVICLGGSATNDCGIGAARALGVRFTSHEGRELKTVSEALNSPVVMDASGIDERVKGIRFIALCDVKNPLLGKTGATAVYGPQKGVTAELYDSIEEFMRNVGELYNSFAGRDVCSPEGAGAAGGMGAMLLALLGARLDPGAATVLERIGFDDALNAADMLITGEGRFDISSIKYSKAAGEALKRAAAADKPAVVLAGQVDEACFDLIKAYNAIAVSTTVNPVECAEAYKDAQSRLKAAADRVFSLLKQGAKLRTDLSNV